MDPSLPHLECQRCGAKLPENPPHGLCPACLMRAAMATDGNSDLNSKSGAPSTIDSRLPTPAELASLFPQLDVQELVGWGGMGAVYRARQTHLDRLVALKIVRPEVSRDPMFAERFNREARLLARLNHPNIVAIYEFGKQEVAANGELPAQTLYYFVMEYVDGTNLRQLIREQTLTPPQALAIVPQVCDALQFAHDEGVVHRDIKPENILVDRRGRVKIADFGLAKLANQLGHHDSLTSTHDVMGTPRYMAPEQMDGFHQVDHRADIYSLGVVFYELLTGHLPLGHFEPPSQKVEVDIRLDQVVLRTLARDPERRYQQASHVRTDVEAVRQSHQVAVTTAMSNAADPKKFPELPGDPLDEEERQRNAELAELPPDSEYFRIIGLFLGAWVLMGWLCNLGVFGLFASVGLLLAILRYTLHRLLVYLPPLRKELSRTTRLQRAVSLVVGSLVLFVAILFGTYAVDACMDSIITSMTPGASSFRNSLSAEDRAKLARLADIPELAEASLVSEEDGSFRLLFFSVVFGSQICVFLVFMGVGLWIETRRYRYTWKYWWRPALGLTLYLLGTGTFVSVLVRSNVLSKSKSTPERTVHCAADWNTVEQRLTRWMADNRYRVVDNKTLTFARDKETPTGHVAFRHLEPWSGFERYSVSARGTLRRPKPRMIVTLVARTSPAKTFVRISMPPHLPGTDELERWNKTVDGLADALD